MAAASGDARPAFLLCMVPYGPRGVKRRRVRESRAAPASLRPVLSGAFPVLREGGVRQPGETLLFPLRADGGLLLRFAAVDGFPQAVAHVERPPEEARPHDDGENLLRGCPGGFPGAPEDGREDRDEEKEEDHQPRPGVFRVVRLPGEPHAPAFAPLDAGALALLPAVFRPLDDLSRAGVGAVRILSVRRGLFFHDGIRGECRLFFLFSIKKNKRRFYRSRVSVPSDFRKAGMKKAGASRLFPVSEELLLLFEDGRRICVTLHKFSQFL